jgi:hypothetical protein
MVSVTIPLPIAKSWLFTLPVQLGQIAALRFSPSGLMSENSPE